MKKLLLIAALAALSNPALASKARLNALSNAEHLKDAQTAFNNPSHLLLFSDYATFEMGPTNIAVGATPSTTAAAEGGFIRSHGDAKYGVYFGRKSDFTTVARSLAGYLGQENPIELQYAMKGDISWGAGLNYSSSDKKSTGQKQSAMGARFGAYTDQWEAYAILGLGSSATGTTAAATLNPVADADAKYKGTVGFKVGAAYKMDHLYYYAKYYQDGAKNESALNAATTDGLEVKQSQMDIGVVDHNKIDGGQWFYGVGYQVFESKRENAPLSLVNSKTNTTSLPFLLGLEYDAASWMTLRLSATQNVLIGSTKVDPPGESDTIGNNTTVAAGFGLRMNKWVLDGSWAAQTTGDVNGTAFITNAALSYNF